MPFSFDDLLYGGAIPLIVSLVTTLLAGRLLSSDTGVRWTASLSLLTGFLTGYGLLSLGPLLPTAHWHWLPYVLIASTIIGATGQVPALTWLERLLLVLLATGVAAWVLVPDWEDLNPSRITYVVGFVGCLVMLTGLLTPLEQRLPGPVLPAVLWATMTAASIVLALSGSLRFAQIGIAAASALCATMIVAMFRREHNAVSGISLPFATLTISSLLIGQVNSFSEVPWASYLLVPLAPATLWLTVAGPVSRLSDGKRLTLRLLFPAVVLGGAVLLAALAEMSGGVEY